VDLRGEGYGGDVMGKLWEIGSWTSNGIQLFNYAAAATIDGDLP
jgi:hypothetical protein